MERRLVLAVLFVCFAMAVPVLLLLAEPGLPVRDFGLAVAMAVSLAVPFLPAISEPFFSLRYFEALSAEGWLVPEEQEYLEELARYLRLHGEDGRIPGSLRWAALYLSLFFFGGYVGSLILFVSLYPALERWTVPYLAAIEVPFAVACGLLNRRRVKKLFRDAAERGYRLAEIRRSMTKGIRP